MSVFLAFGVFVCHVVESGMPGKQFVHEHSST